MRVEYHPAAATELIAAVHFYEDRVAALGERYLAEVNRAIERVCEHPLRWPVLEADIRRYVLSDFPCAIYYRALPDRIRILAVKHHRRHPEYWRSRH